MITAKEVEQELRSHEELCAERYANIHARIDKIEAVLNKLLWTIIVGFGSIVVSTLIINKAEAAETTINYKGQPVPSAMAPSMSAYSQDVCAVPASGGINTGVFAVSGGTVLTDENCVRIKLAKTLNDLGLKVSAVSVLCEDIKVWNAMEMSGSPCPIGAALGDAARHAWYELYPERFTKLYGEDFKMPTYTTPINLSE
jgi:hypothetical protein